MFESDIRIEVERRLQKACDERARDGLPAPVSVDALRAVVRADLMKELEAQRTATKPPPAPAKIAAVSKPVAPRPAPAAARPKPSGMGLLMDLMGKAGSGEPVLPSLRV